MPKKDDGLQQLAQILQLANIAQAPQDAQQRQALALMELQQRAQERGAQAQYQQQALAQSAAEAAAMQEYRNRALTAQTQMGQDRNALDLVQAQMQRGEPVNWDMVPEPMRSAYQKQQAEAFQQQIQMAQPLAESVFNGPAVKGLDPMTQLLTAFAKAKIQATPELLGALDLSRANPWPGYTAPKTTTGFFGAPALPVFTPPQLPPIPETGPAIPGGIVGTGSRTTPQKRQLTLDDILNRK